MTLNDHWGFHISDEEWKSPRAVIRMLLTCANGNGNLLLNIGPRGDGSVPERSAEIVRTVGKWLADGGREAVTDNVLMTLNPYFRKADERTDWDGAGIFSASGNNMFFTMLYCPGEKLTFTGFEMQVERIVTRQAGELKFVQSGDRIEIVLPESLRSAFCPVLRMECASAPSIYRTGGMRIPKCRHTRYDPCTSDIQY